MAGKHLTLNPVRSTMSLIHLSHQILTNPDGPISLEPSATVFHYAQCLFEGLKAYRDANGKVTMFRPELNMLRMNRSASRLALPVQSL